jgi:hypothetical protein
MDLLLAPGNVFNAAGGALIVLVGLYALSVRPRTLASKALALFCIGFGAPFTYENVLAPSGAERLVPDLATTLSLVVGGVGLMLIAARVPRRLGRADHAAVLAGVAVATVMLVLNIATTAAAEPLPSRAVSLTAYSFLHSAYMGTLVVLALAYAHAPTGPLRRQYALMSAAMLPFPGIGVASTLLLGLRTPLGDRTLSTGAAAQAFGAVTYVLLVLLAAAWLRNAASSEPRERRIALVAAVLGLAVPVLASLSLVLTGAQSGTQLGFGGFSRTLGAAVLAYAILRGQLLGIDLKVKWTIRRGTLAGIFIAVFFVVSQVAQNWLQQYGVLAGGVAAGLLLFGLTPLQRFAERVADTAMPGVKAPGEMTRDERVAFYREHLRLAYADGTVDRGERLMLRHAREHLGLDAELAERIEAEVAGGQA